MARDRHSRTLGEGRTVASSLGVLESDFVADGETIGAAASPSDGVRVMAGGIYFAETQDSVSVCPESGVADCSGYEVDR